MTEDTPINCRMCQSYEFLLFSNNGQLVIKCKKCHCNTNEGLHKWLSGLK